MKVFIKWLKSLFAMQDYGSRLEQYIVNSNPTNISDVENLAAQYGRNLSRGIV